MTDGLDISQRGKMISENYSNFHSAVFSRDFLRICKVHFTMKTTKFCDISTLLLSYVVPVKSKVEISQNFVAISRYMNFNAWKLKKNLVKPQVNENYNTPSKFILPHCGIF